MITKTGVETQFDDFRYDFEVKCPVCGQPYIVVKDKAVPACTCQKGSTDVKGT